MSPGVTDIPLWIKITYTLFVCLLVPVYLRHYGPANFLWFSDVALLVTVPASPSPDPFPGPPFSARAPRASAREKIPSRSS